MQLLVIIVIFLFVLVLFTVFIYNRLVAARNRVSNSWSQIDVQLKRRYELIPNLVNSVKGYMDHEKTLLEKLTETRAQAISAGNDIKKRAEAEGTITLALRSLFAVTENYPELKASQNMLALQEELAATENKISFARQAYNDSVMEYNTSSESFPANLLAQKFGFKGAEFFELDDTAERKNPEVQFKDNNKERRT
jgi:LemA protein